MLSLLFLSLLSFGNVAVLINTNKTNYKFNIEKCLADWLTSLSRRPTPAQISLIVWPKVYLFIRFDLLVCFCFCFVQKGSTQSVEIRAGFYGAFVRFHLRYVLFTRIAVYTKRPSEIHCFIFALLLFKHQHSKNIEYQLKILTGPLHVEREQQQEGRRRPPAAGVNKGL